MPIDIANDGRDRTEEPMSEIDEFRNLRTAVEATDEFRKRLTAAEALNQENEKQIRFLSTKIEILSACDSAAVRCYRERLLAAEAELAERSADIRTLAAQRAAANARAEKAEEHRDKLLEAWKPDPLCGHAFVAGARWWQSHVVGATPFPSETDEMESEAAKRYPFAPHPIVIDLEEKAARLAAECRADRMCTGAQSSMEFAEFSCTRKAARAAVDAAGDLTEGGTA